MKEGYSPEVREIADKAGILAEEVLDFMKSRTNDMRVALSAIELLHMSSNDVQKSRKSRFN